MAGKVIHMSMEEFEARRRAGGPPTRDDQSRTWDGRVLNTKEAVLEFLAELDEARAEGRTIGPDVPSS